MNYEKTLILYQNFVKKQNLFFKYALYILLNISEDIKLEYKIVSKDIITVLVDLLDRNSADLLLVIVIYLKKLSIFVENKSKMKDLNIIKHLIPLLFMDNHLVVYNTLKLIYNLIIDRELRVLFIRSGVMSKLVGFVSKGHYTSVCISLFYLFSCEPKYVALFKNYPAFIHTLLDQVLQDVEYKAVLVSLLINLSSNYKVAHLIVNYCDYNELIKLACLDKNVDLLKLIRNISCHPDDVFKLSLVKYFGNLTELVVNSSDNSSLMVEVASILANLSNHVDMALVWEKHSLLQFLVKILDCKRSKEKEPSGAALWSILLWVALSVHQEQLVTHFINNNLIEILLNFMQG